MAVQCVDRFVELPTTAADITTRLNGSIDDWLMIDAERCAFLALMTRLKPRCAIEVGVYRAGSLAVLASYSDKVYAIDIDPACVELYATKFPNVTFITGTSHDILPGLIDRIQKTREPLDFVVLDADHTEKGVRGDIERLLHYQPHQPLYIIMHDSFNPGCRKGMKEAAWSESPFVHLVELDFVPGRLVSDEAERDYREMWCGFALAVLLPEKRAGGLVVHENESLLFQAALRQSVYRYENSRNPLVYFSSLAERTRRAAYLLKTDRPAFCAAIKRRITR
jgi:Cephalosporin hydroxylase